MVRQYPHRLTYAAADSSSPAPVPNENGDWTFPAGMDAPSAVQVACRAETNGTHQTIAGQDGRQLDYAFVVYLPKGTAPIDEGTAIEVHSDAGLLVQTVVKQFYSGQLNCKLYV